MNKYYTVTSNSWLFYCNFCVARRYCLFCCRHILHSGFGWPLFRTKSFFWQVRTPFFRNLFCTRLFSAQFLHNDIFWQVLKFSSDKRLLRTCHGTRDFLRLGYLRLIVNWLCCFLFIVMCANCCHSRQLRANFCSSGSDHGAYVLSL